MFHHKRVEEQLLSFLAKKIRQLTDPRIEPTTLTDIKMSPDLKTAWIYWSAPPSEEDGSLAEEYIKVINEAFKGASNYLKRKIAQELKLRFTPNLRFAYDSSFSQASKIDQLLKQVGE